MEIKRWQHGKMVQASFKHQTFKVKFNVVFVHHIKLLNFVLVLSGRLFHCKEISLWPAKTSFSVGFSQKPAVIRPLVMMTTAVLVAIHLVVNLELL